MAIMSPYWLEQIKLSSWQVCVIVCLEIFAFLLVVKSAVGIGLVLFSGNLHNNDLRRRLVEDSSSDKVSNAAPGYPDESLVKIERYMSIKGRMVG